MDNQTPDFDKIFSQIPKTAAVAVDMRAGSSPEKAFISITIDGTHVYGGSVKTLIGLLARVAAKYLETVDID